MKVSEDLKAPARQIQMVDLKSQYLGIEDEVRTSFDEIISTTAFINGPYVRRFQAELEEYLRVKHVIPCGNGTDALQVALMALGLQPGDEVIVPSFTFIASVEVIGLLQLTPILVDVDERTFNMDVEQLEQVIGPRTKVVLPVHLFGQCSNMNAILEVAERHGLSVVEDNAQSIGARYSLRNGTEKMSGCMGDIGSMSFYPSKNLGCYGDGGAIVTNDDDRAQMIRSIVNHGFSGQKYYHERIGVNSRLDSFQAAVLSAKLKHLDTYNETRQNAAAFYDSRLSPIQDVIVPGRTDSSTHVFHQYTIRVPEIQRDALKEHLGKLGIPSMIYYPVPMEEQVAFRDMVKTPVSLERTSRLCKTVLSLPMHSELDEEQLTYICRGVESFFGQ